MNSELSDGGQFTIQYCELSIKLSILHLRPFQVFFLILAATLEFFHQEKKTKKPHKSTDDECKEEGGGVSDCI